MSEVFALEFESPQGERLRFEWNPESLERLDSELGESTPWRLDGQLDWDEVELVRVLSARFEDGRLFGLAALRPAGAEGHGEEIVVSALVDGNGQLDAIDETLFSVEYDGSGLPRRVGLELYRGEGSMPLRVAGDVIATGGGNGGELERTSAAVSLRLTGAAGSGRLDVLRRHRP